MSDQEANGIRAGYRRVSILLVVGLAGIGFTRLEDRAIIGLPGAPANAMAALSVPENSGPTESYSEDPDESVSLGNASRAPTNRIRRVLRDRDVPVVATREILAPSNLQGPNSGVEQGNPGLNPPLIPALAPLEPTAPAFASLAPRLAGQGSPIFAANLRDEGIGGGTGNTGGGNSGGGNNSGGNNGGDGGGSNGGDGGGSNGGDGGGSNGGDGGGSNGGDGGGGGIIGGGSNGGGSGGGGGGGGVIGGGGNPDTPVTAVPEPGTWLTLVLGLFAIGGALRRRAANSEKRTRPAISYIS